MDDARRGSILADVEVPDLQNAFDLRDESLEESEVAAGGAPLSAEKLRILLFKLVLSHNTRIAELGPDHAEHSEWVAHITGSDAPFDPAFLDMPTVNRALAKQL